jgi:hypothetical protein
MVGVKFGNKPGPKVRLGGVVVSVLATGPKVR